MIPAATQLPGLSFTRAPRAVEPSPVRSDIAGFAGRARRGPVGEPVRVEGWKEYLSVFGGLEAGACLPYAIRGYFENGGDVAYVVRLWREAGQRFATSEWDTSKPDVLTSLSIPPAGVRHSAYGLQAKQPGAWANGTRITIHYRRRGVSGAPEVDFIVDAPNEPSEYLAGLPLADLAARLETLSAYLRLAPKDPVLAPAANGPNRLTWTLELKNAVDGAPRATEYAAALTRLLDEQEVALIGLPDLHGDLQEAEARELLRDAIARVDTLHDRMVLVDAPWASGPAGASAAQLMAWADGLRGSPAEGQFRSSALYHPWLEVPDPLGGIVRPLKSVPPCGHVAGVVSRLDRERGPHHTPANAQLFDAVDLAERLEPDAQAALNAAAVNLLRCMPGRGLQVWGASTLARLPQGAAATRPYVADHFVAYRRLIHRLVRAIQRTAEPLVFEANGPELWLRFVRTVTTVLLEAYRRGALKGARPDEAFRVRCDEKTNPPEERELGRCVCEIALAPAAPMEFIVLRVALGGEGTLEVFES